MKFQSFHQAEGDEEEQEEVLVLLPPHVLVDQNAELLLSIKTRIMFAAFLFFLIALVAFKSERRVNTLRKKNGCDAFL